MSIAIVVDDNLDWSFLLIPCKNMQKKANFFAGPNFVSRLRGILDCGCAVRTPFLLIVCKNVQKKTIFFVVPTFVSRLGGILGWGRCPLLLKPLYFIRELDLFVRSSWSITCLSFSKSSVFVFFA
jgi:hypothetical protein